MPLPVTRPVEHPVVGRVIGPLGPGIVHADDLPPRQAPANEASPFATERPYANPRGGVIGAPFEDVPTTRPPSARPYANPPGGVIGPTTGRETEGMFTPMGGAGGARSGEQRTRRGRDEYRSRDHWPTPKGVPPVIEPGPEPVHDPGPFIGPHP